MCHGEMPSAINMYVRGASTAACIVLYEAHMVEAVGQRRDVNCMDVAMLSHA